jgi:hypothetical protein
MFARRDVHDFQRIVAERSYEKPAPFRVDGKVVEPSVNTGQRYGFGVLERRRLLRADAKGRRAKQQTDESLHGIECHLRP